MEELTDDSWEQVGGLDSANKTRLLSNCSRDVRWRRTTRTLYSAMGSPVDLAPARHSGRVLGRPDPQLSDARGQCSRYKFQLEPTNVTN